MRQSGSRGFTRRKRRRALLAPLYATVTEGFDLPDLVEAKALLGDLR